MQQGNGADVVSIARFSNMAEAEIAKGSMETAGIECFLTGENASLLYGGNLGGTELMVASDDRDAAIELLKGSVISSSGKEAMEDDEDIETSGE